MQEFWGRALLAGGFVLTVLWTFYLVNWFVHLVMSVAKAMT
jgi:hypothetical protein